MSRSVNPVEWLKTLYGKAANIRQLASKTAVFTIKLFLSAFISVYVGVVVLLLVTLLILTRFDLTDNPIANRWLNLAIPMTCGFIVGMRISLENFRKHGTTTLYGLENALRTIVGASAVAMETHFAIVSIFWQVGNYIETLDRFFPDDVMPIVPSSAQLPVIAEFMIFLLGLIGLIYITERAFIMQSPSKYTAKAQTGHYIRRKWRRLKCLWDRS